MRVHTLSPSRLLFPAAHFLPLLFSCALTPAAATTADDTPVWVTPHESYSSSVGVLGCKIDTNRVAYWPASVSCGDSLCVRLSHPASGRSLHLLRVDQSQGAYDVSYDAWNFLVTGKSATEEPVAGGATEMAYRYVGVDECKDLIHTAGDDGTNGKKVLPLSASNSMNYLAACVTAEPDSWVGGGNYALYNIQDAVCTWGVDEVCELEDFPTQNQAECPSGLGSNAELEGNEVYNVKYPTGETVEAGTGQVVDNPGSGAQGGRGRSAGGWGLVGLVAVTVVAGRLVF